MKKENSLGKIKMEKFKFQKIKICNKYLVRQKLFKSNKIS